MEVMHLIIVRRWRCARRRKKTSWDRKQQESGFQKSVQEISLTFHDMFNVIAARLLQTRSAILLANTTFVRHNHRSNDIITACFLWAKRGAAKRAKAMSSETLHRQSGSGWFISCWTKQQMLKLNLHRPFFPGNGPKLVICTNLSKAQSTGETFLSAWYNRPQDSSHSLTSVHVSRAPVTQCGIVEC